MAYFVKERTSLMIAVNMMMLGITCVPLKAGNTPNEHDPAALTSTSITGFEDAGDFVLYVNEEVISKMTSHVYPDGRFTGTSVMTMAGQSVNIELTIEPDESGSWSRISQISPAGEVIVKKSGMTATQSYLQKTTTIDLKEGMVLFDNNCPMLISHIIRVYGSKASTKITFPVFLIPGMVLDGSLEKLSTQEKSLDGKDIMFDRFLFSIAGIDLTVWVDDKCRVYWVQIPAQNAQFIRSGAEMLVEKTPVDPLLSQPRFEVKQESNVMIPMRDGIRLATDVYKPEADGQYPVIFVRTPYQKTMLELQAKYYARRGYIYAVQDCRGRFASEGIWEPFIHEAEDGYDSIEWLASQPYSNGKTGMIGASYVGWVQWWAAAEKPPHLTTIIPNVAPPDPVYNIPYEYGVFFNLGSIWWAAVLESEATGELSGRTFMEINEKKYMELLKPLPVIEQDRAILGKENSYWRKWIQHQPHDDYWNKANFLNKLKKVDIPVFHQSGWFDGDGIGSKLNYLKMKECGHGNQKLILGPWGHTDTADRMHGELDFGSEALINLQREYLRWMDYWLKGIDNGIIQDPLVQIFVMGKNIWLKDQVYPLSNTQFQKWYLSSDGHANTSKGNGRLTLSAPAKDNPPDRYLYDPDDPSPSPHYFEVSSEEEKQVMSYDAIKARSESHHEEVTKTREDILVYQTEPFEKEYTFAGPVQAVIHAASSAKDTDWFARLVWISKDGKNRVLSEGKIRARYRQSIEKPKMLKPGKIYEYTLDLWQTGITIPAGDRIRLEIASASFPLFSRNLNTGGNNETETVFVKAEQTIYHDTEHPSYLLLPSIP